MSQQRPLRGWREKDPFSASHLDEAVEMLRPLSNITGGGITHVTQFPNGTSVYTPEQTLPSLDKVRLVRVTGNEAGGGKYTGVILDAPASDVAAAGNLTAADMGVVGESVRLINGYEVAAGTHDLTSAGKSAEAIAVYRRTNSDGVKVFAIVLVQTEDCAAGSGGAPAATSNNFLLMGA